jgi:hypothetical protein
MEEADLQGRTCLQQSALEVVPQRRGGSVGTGSVTGLVLPAPLCHHLVGWQLGKALFFFPWWQESWMTLVSSTRSSNFFCLQFVAVKQQDVTLVVVVVVVASQMLMPVYAVLLSDC